jgi:plasmid stabilization system protein ParE
VEINWSPRSEQHLQRIYFFYLENATEQVALSVILRIVEKTQQLAYMPFSGGVAEEVTMGLHQYRFLVYKHFKIYYFVTAELIEIAGVFDCRQDPDKLVEFL